MHPGMDSHRGVLGAGLALTLATSCGRARTEPTASTPVANQSAQAPLCRYTGELEDTDVVAAGKRVAWLSGAEGSAAFEQEGSATTLLLEASDGGWTVRGHAELDGEHPLALRALTAMTPGMWLRAGVRPVLLAAEPGAVRIGLPRFALDDSWRFAAAAHVGVACEELAMGPFFQAPDTLTEAERDELDLGPGRDHAPSDRYLPADVTQALHDAPDGKLLAHHRHDDDTQVEVVERRVVGGDTWARLVVAYGEAIVSGWMRDAELAASGRNSIYGGLTGSEVDSSAPSMHCTLAEPLDILVAPDGAPDGDTSTLVSIGTAAPGASFVASGQDPAAALLQIVSIDAQSISPDGDWLLRPPVPPSCVPK